MRVVRFSYARSVLTVLIVAALAGCVGQSAPETVHDPVTAPDPADAKTYRCNEVEIPRMGLERAARLTDQDSPKWDEILQTTYSPEDDEGTLAQHLPDRGSWTVAVDTSNRVVLLRRHAMAPAPGVNPEFTGTDDLSAWYRNQDHEAIVVAKRFDEGWIVESRGFCNLTLDLGELQVPSIWFSPEHAPDPGARELTVSVLDAPCVHDAASPSGPDFVRIDETEAEVRVLLAGRLPDGRAFDCGFSRRPPAYTYTVKLDAPLGERAVIDATRVDRWQLWPFPDAEIRE